MSQGCACIECSSHMLLYPLLTLHGKPTTISFDCIIFSFEYHVCPSLMCYNSPTSCLATTAVSSFENHLIWKLVFTNCTSPIFLPTWSCMMQLLLLKVTWCPFVIMNTWEILTKLRNKKTSRMVFFPFLVITWMFPFPLVMKTTSFLTRIGT